MSAPDLWSEGDIDAARATVAAARTPLTELLVYSGAVHLFTDESLPSFDAAATDLVVERIGGFIDALES